jgi:hypothetical protein
MDNINHNTPISDAAHYFSEKNKPVAKSDRKSNTKSLFGTNNNELLDYFKDAKKKSTSKKSKYYF